MNALVILVWLLDRLNTLSWCNSRPNVWEKMRSQSLKMPSSGAAS